MKIFMIIALLCTISLANADSKSMSCWDSASSEKDPIIKVDFKIKSINMKNGLVDNASAKEFDYYSYEMDPGKTHLLLHPYGHEVFLIVDNKAFKEAGYKFSATLNYYDMPFDDPMLYADQKYDCVTK